MDGLSLGLAIAAVASAYGLTWAIGKLLSPVGVEKPSSPGIDYLMSQPIAAYTFPRKAAEEVSEEPMTPQSDIDIRIQLARQEQKVESLTGTVEREFARMADALGKHADAVNAAFNAMKSEFVPKADFAASLELIKRLEKIVYGACGVVLLSVLGALVALVVTQ